jgi:hypothetical protein
MKWCHAMVTLAHLYRALMRIALYFVSESVFDGRVEVGIKRLRLYVLTLENLGWPGWQRQRCTSNACTLRKATRYLIKRSDPLQCIRALDQIDSALVGLVDPHSNRCTLLVSYVNDRLWIGRIRPLSYNQCSQ